MPPPEIPDPTVPEALMVLIVALVVKVVFASPTKPLYQGKRRSLPFSERVIPPDAVAVPDTTSLLPDVVGRATL